MTTLSKLIHSTVAAALGVALVSAPAHAGRGSSAEKIRAAIRTQNPTAIAAELERAEYLWCGGCIDDVMQLLDHQEYSVREVAAWWFARRAAQKRELTERSLAYLVGSNSVAARNAADILGTFRMPIAVPALSEALSNPSLDAEARLAIVRALGTIGERSANPALSRAMTDSSPLVRSQAVQAWLDIRGQRDAAPVIALLSDSDTLVRRQATSVVGNLRDSVGRAQLEQLVVRDEDPVVRRNAAWALGRIGDLASRSTLEAAVNDASGLVRGTARVALRELR